MRKILITIGVLVCLVFVLIGSGLAILKWNYPKISPAPDLTISVTPAMIEHGHYLANHITPCMDCHSKRDWNTFTAPLIKGTMGMGGEKFDEGEGIPGTVYAPNITPAGIGTWTDGEVYRAITTGVTKTGSVLFPVMPYLAFGKMDPYDVKSIIAYVRTLKPIKHNVLPSDIHFPMNFIMRTIPTAAHPMKRPAASDTLAYGKYLVTIAACTDCHTPMDKGQPIDSLSFAGGFHFRLPTGGVVQSANITPDSSTGIGLWSEKTFLKAFKKFDVPLGQLKKVKHNQFNTVMPWTMYAGMKDNDLRSIYRYLRTIKPVFHKVVQFTPDKP